MKLLSILIATLLLCASSGWAEEKVKELTADQRLALRDAQVPMLTATREFSDFMLKIQKQLESIPEYQKLKANAETTSAKFNKVAREVLDKECADCQIDHDTLTLKKAPKQ